jgi:hypothetical protein
MEEKGEASKNQLLSLLFQYKSVNQILIRTTFTAPWPSQTHKIDVINF